MCSYMKVINTSPEALRSAGMEVLNIQVSTDPEDQLMMFKIMADSLYTDKIAAPMRELGCNAYDANVEAGRANVPIEVTLPTRLDPVLMVRDFGFGLTPEQIRSTFCQVTRSTKRDNNLVTGFMGIGSKSPYAYGPSFMVTSYTNGEKRVYNCYRDQGAPKMAVMSMTTTEAPDGLEVRMPVKPEDVDEFVRKGERIFRYFEVIPKIRGAKIDFSARKVLAKGNSWRFCGDRDVSVAIMGNIGYDIDHRAMGTTDNRVINLLGAGMEFDFELGELEIAANREGLQYTDFTKRALLKRLQSCVDEVAAEVTRSIASAKTLWEAKLIYYNVYRKMGSSANRMDVIVGDKVTWQGKRVDSIYVDIRIPSGDSSKFCVRYAKAVYLSVAAARKSAVNPADLCIYEQIIINDTGRAISPARVKSFFEKNPTETAVSVFFFDSDKTRLGFWKDKELDGAPTSLLSSYPKWIDPNASVVGGSAVSVHRSKHSAKVLVWGNDAPKVRSCPRSGWWNPGTVDLKKESGVYVDLHEFRIGKAGSNPEEFFSFVQELEKAGIKPPTIYGFKRAVKDRINSVNWKSLEEYCCAKVATDLFQDKARLQTFVDWQMAKASRQGLLFESDILLPQKPSAARRVVEAFKKMAVVSKTDEALFSLINSSSTNFWFRPLPAVTLSKPTFDLKALDEAARAAYPLLNLMRGDGGRYGQLYGPLPHKSAFIDYINLVNK